MECCRQYNEHEEQGQVYTTVYMTVVIPPLVYGAQTRELTKVQETKLEVAEMRMLWVCGVMNMNKNRHERIGGQRK